MLHEGSIPNCSFDVIKLYVFLYVTCIRYKKSSRIALKDHLVTKELNCCILSPSLPSPFFLRLFLLL